LIEDEAWILSHAWAIAQGQTPHVDFFDPYLSGAYLPVALAFRFTGPSVLVGRLAAVLVLGGIVVLGYRAAGRPANWLVGLVAWGAFVVSAYIDFYSQHWVFVLLALALLGVIARGARTGRAPAAWAVGLLLGAAAVCSPPRTLVLAPAVLGALAIQYFRPAAAAGPAPSWGAFAGRAARLLGWSAWPVLALVGGLALRSPRYLGAMLGDTVGFSVRDYLARATMPLGLLFEQLDFSGPLPAAGSVTALVSLALPPLVAGPVLLAAGVRALRGRAVRTSPHTLALALFAGAGWLSSLNRPDAIHFNFSLPLALPLVLERLGHLAQLRPRLGRGVAAGVALGAGLVALPIFCLTLADKSRFSVRVPTRAGVLWTHARDPRAAVIGELLRRVPAGARLVAVPYSPSYPLLLGTTNPTRYTFLVPGYQGRSQVATVTALLRARGAEFVLVRPGQFERGFYRRYFPRADLGEAAQGLADWHAALAAGWRESARLGDVVLYEPRPDAPASGP
jgi:hypothetical protein